MITKITSNDNKILKQIRKLSSKSERQKEGKFIAEGLRLVRDAMQFSNVEYLLVTKEEADFETDVPKFLVNSSIFQKISDTKSPQGILAVCKIEKHDEIIGKNIIICDGVKDPGNMGTIIRTAECAGFESVVLINECVDPYNLKVVRSTMGSIFRMPIIICDINKIKELQDYKICVTMLDGATNLFETEFGEKTAVVVGNEANGVSKEMINLASIRVKIPMLGSAESLNAAVSASVTMYEVYRKKNNLSMEKK